MGARVGSTAFERPLVRRASMAVLVALLVAPVVFDADDFPLSTYPMYARVRPAEVGFVTAQGVDPNGEIVVLGLDTVGATDDPLIAAGELRAAIRADQAARRCREIAERVARKLDANRDATRDIVAVEIVTERHDVIDHTSGRPSLIERTVHASCDVARRSSGS